MAILAACVLCFVFFFIISIIFKFEWNPTVRLQNLGDLAQARAKLRLLISNSPLG